MQIYIKSCESVMQIYKAFIGLWEVWIWENENWCRLETLSLDATPSTRALPSGASEEGYAAICRANH